MTQIYDTGTDPAAATLPRRAPGAGLDSGGYDLSGPDSETYGGGQPAHQAVHAELITLRDRVPGVRGCVVAGPDGMLIGHDLAPDADPTGLAMLAATTFDLGRRSGLALQHGPFRELTLHSQKGYFSVYAVSDVALLAVLGDDWLNVTRLHQEARPVAERLADLLHGGGTT